MVNRIKQVDTVRSTQWRIFMFSTTEMVFMCCLSAFQVWGQSSAAVTPTRASQAADRPSLGVQSSSASFPGRVGGGRFELRTGWGGQDGVCERVLGSHIGGRWRCADGGGAGGARASGIEHVQSRSGYNNVEPANVDIGCGHCIVAVSPRCTSTKGRSDAADCMWWRRRLCGARRTAVPPQFTKAVDASFLL